jgi:hypothetical protein
LTPRIKQVIVYWVSLCILMAGCSYTTRSVKGNKISAAQVQEIKLNKTNESDLLMLLGPPANKENKADGTLSLLYTYHQIKSPTFPGGYVIYGLMDQEEDEVFEVILKGGVVQSFHFLRP